MLASWDYECSGSRFLVVVPVTLLEQWRRELDAWAGFSEIATSVMRETEMAKQAQNTGLAVHVMHGALPERRAALRGHVQSPDFRPTASSHSGHDRFLAAVFCSSPMPVAYTHRRIASCICRCSAEMCCDNGWIVRIWLARVFTNFV